MSGGEPGLIYSLIAKGTIVMTEYSSREGNFVVLAKRILTNIQPGDHKRSFFDKSGRYVFHYQVKDGVTFLCFATKEHKTAVCFAYLDEVSKRFKATYEPSQIENAMAYSPQFEDFARVLEQEMNRFGHMQFADNKIAEVNEKVEATKDVMKDNLNKVIERGDNIETLIEKTDILVQRSDSFRVNTKTLERKIWWKNVKIWIILILVCIFLAWLILSLACGFDMACFRGGSACFHESTQISYKGRAYSLSELAQEAECAIPHTVVRDGVSIATDCSAAPLRLTSDHLVAVDGGFVPAGSLHEGVLLFNEHNERCRVLGITAESKQQYFGLNCLESVVLANGVRTSTFGNYHTLPALWMSWAGRVLGVKTASHVGDSIVNVLAKTKML